MRLYWRIKKNGKWTWRPASKAFLEHIGDAVQLYGIDLMIVEEEE